MIEEFFNQLLIAFHQWTSFQVGSFNMADMVINLQSAFLDSSFVFVLKIISVLITIVLGAATVFLIIKRKEFDTKLASQEVLVAEAVGAGPLQEQWNDILRHIDSIREGEWKFAVIEADTIVDNVLRNYFPGDTMGERLMNIDKTKLLSIDDLWEAHKIRNHLAHDSNYFLRHAEALRAIRLFESTLKELGAIE
ncbi:MAG: hypothetical protein A2735_03005 [Candidatus Yanofskybacteria bacterium RIFCSPHIGHO2_01_FULL_41_21]|uniref:DUF4145 domain-containing protein n=1 Tax=Candidatus Yanofskybacteria bacterium RIFCSPHIGHO2_01_FULL_41_21 TaxID=1802660 RepID=A0A1F8EAI2_9BACT|nr:MAG: hypothetical protein A2735_03005 [Candidatus Yanofskybacteria bacterium RIFCSPHIGHO2_01_FULL_41_21]